MFGFIDHEACGILALQPGTELVFSALEGEVLTSGLPGKSSFSYTWHKGWEKSSGRIKYVVSLRRWLRRV